jgi:hypothetical protein
MELSADPLNALTKTALKSLADIAVPPPVSYLPHTWGWAALGCLLLAIAALLVWRWFRHWTANRYRREALAELDALEHSISGQSIPGRIEPALAELLKRTALAAWPREDVASLNGAEWATFLAAHAPRGKVDKVLADLVNEQEYLAAATAKASGDYPEQLVAAVRRWIGGHHVSA